MAYQNIATPRFFVDLTEFLKTVDKSYSPHSVTTLLPVKVR